MTRGGVYAAGVFYRLERSGPVIPEGPALIVVNHPNMLMDPLLALGATRRRVRTIAKAPHFRTPIFGSILQGVDALPVYRLRDDPRLVARNKTTLRQAADVLIAGGALLLFPEGGSHPDPRLRPLKAGAARLALTAEAESGWTLGLVVVPVGLTYENRGSFRSRALAAVGPPLPVNRWRAAYAEDRVRAIRSLTDEMKASLEGLTLNGSSHSDLALVDWAEQFHARAIGLAGWRERRSLGERMPRLQRFARRLDWLRANHREEYERLTGALRSYLTARRRLGGVEAAVQPEGSLRAAARELGIRGAILALGAPLAALGAIVWYVPYALTGFANKVGKPVWETVATVKVLAGLVLYPATYVAWIVVAGFLAGAIAALATAVALPPLLLFTLRWGDARKEVWSDMRMLWSVARRPRTYKRLLRQRINLAAELEPLAAEARSTQEGRYPVGRSSP